MDRASAERVFALIADLNGDLRGKVVSERWWLIWMLMGIQMMITSTVTHAVVQQGERRLLIYLVIWGIHCALIPLIIAFVHRRAGGQRTATETYIRWIWTTFIICAVCIVIFNHVIGLPIAALLAAFAFSMMAMVTYRFFLIFAAAFLPFSPKRHLPHRPASRSHISTFRSAATSGSLWLRFL